MDPYQSPDQQSSSTLEAIIQRLEDRGQDDRFNGFIDDYLEKVDLSKVSTVLDLGCGTGVVTRRLAQALPAGTKLMGVDISEVLLDQARASSDPEIEWVHARGEEIPLGDGSMDLVILHTLLSHVPDPTAVLREAKRVLSDRGVIVIFDADYASTTYASDDFEKGREIDLKLFGAVVHNLDVCRVMPRHIEAAGLTLTSHMGQVLSEAGRGDFWLSSVKAFAKLIPALKILPEEEAKAWVEFMLSSHDKGTFFAAGNYYTYLVRK